ncbi:MAG: NrfD/PsrC family molybdoenzyme membrane anchor subunit [Desulfobacterales bacterium]|nr:NrfD/PsrC family molybdoenzyme membrane anchor subunit [Desulfobacterales bacterium]
MKNVGRSFVLFAGILLAIMGLGIFNWLRFLSHGPGLTGSSDVVPWGIYISGLAYFIGVSAGATIIGLMIHAFGREDYAPMGIRAILLGLLCIFGATQFVLVDLGVPFRGLKVPLILHNLTSLFLISSSSYYGFMLILLAELYFTVKITRGKATERDKKIVKWLGILAVPYALWVVHAFTGSIFGVVKAREMWNTPMLPVHFVISAIASGFAMVILVAVITSKVEKREILTGETFDHMGRLLAFFLIVTLFLDFFDYFILRYSGKKEAMETWHILTTRYVPLFVMNIGGLAVAFLILLFKKGRTANGLLMATSIVQVAIIAYRIDLVTVGQIAPLFPGMGELQYIPTLPEISVALGLVATVILLYMVLSKVIPMEETVPEEGVWF